MNKEEKIAHIRKLLSRKEAKFVISGEWDKWNYNQGIKVEGLSNKVFQLKKESSELTDQCLERKDWTSYLKICEKIENIEKEIKRIKDEIEDKWLFTRLIWGLEDKLSAVYPDYWKERI